jgi:phenylacetate-CoA ligase
MLIVRRREPLPDAGRGADPAWPASPHFQLGSGPIGSRATVRVEARPEAASADERLRSAQALADLIKETIGVTAAVDVLEPDLIERSAGKAQRVLDLRPSVSSSA